MSLNNPTILDKLDKGGTGYRSALHTFLKQVWQNHGRVGVRLDPFTVATLPDAGTYKWHMVICTDETGGEVPVWSDGTNWRRVTDRVIAS